MTWAKLDDRFIGDPRLLALPRGARLLYIEGLVWCCQQETDGAIPSYVLPRFSDEPDPAAAAGALVTAGLWSMTGTGWQIEGFLDDQPSAADIEKVRELSRARQRKQRQHRDGDHSLCDPKYCRQALSRVTDGVTNGVSHGVSHDTPTRPDPTRPKGREGEREDGRTGRLPYGRLPTAALPEPLTAATFGNRPAKPQLAARTINVTVPDTPTTFDVDVRLPAGWDDSEAAS